MSQGLCSITSQNASARLVVGIFLMAPCVRGENHRGNGMSQPVRLEFPRRFYQREVEAIISLWCAAVLKSLPTVPERGRSIRRPRIFGGVRAKASAHQDLVLFVASRQLLVDMSLIKRVLDQRGMIIGRFVQQAW
jgi:hypothetical protein